MNMRCAAFNTGPDFHLLDHIAPLASLMKMPLFTTEEKNTKLALHYYPQVEVRYEPDLEFKLKHFSEEFEALFECKYWAPHLSSLFRQLYKKEMQLVFCPHGQSDKGFKAPLLAPYAQQDAVLLYGDLLIEMLKELGIWSSISRYAIVGNYRLQFYKKHQSFYDSLAEKEIFSRLSKDKPTLLYAPTWLDADSSTSFFDYGRAIINQLPSSWNLILKLHPLLEQRDPSRFYPIESLVKSKPNIVLLTEFPPVYPILSKVDAYLGDVSSVGYDFLNFRKPLYFLPTKHSERIHSCGRVLPNIENIFPSLEKQISPDILKKQSDLYHYSFGQELSEDVVREKVLETIRNSKREE